MSENFCKGCERNKNHACVMDAFSYRKIGGLMLIGAYPEEVAAREKIHFYSDRRYIIDNILLKHAGIPPNEVTYTYACHCRIRGYDKGPSLKHIRVCRRRTWEEIKYYKPRLIVAIGKEAMALFKDNIQGVKHIRGIGEQYTDSEIGTVNVVYTLGMNVFDVHRSKGESNEDLKRDERELMYADFKWIGNVYRDPQQLHPRQAINFRTKYISLKHNDSFQKYKEALDRIENHERKMVAYDVETRSLTDKRILCLGISPVPGEAYVFPLLDAKIINKAKIDMYEKSIKKDENGNPVKKEDGTVLTTLEKKAGGLTKRGEKYQAMPDYYGEEYIISNTEVRDYVLQRLKKILENPDISKVTQNGSFDAHALRDSFDIRIRGWSDDVMLMYSMINEEYVRGLKALTDIHVPRLRSYSHNQYVYSKEYGVKDFVQFPYDILVPYNAMDADATLCLYYILKSKMMKDPRDWEFYKRYAMQLQIITHGMENNGVMIDLEFINDIQKKLTDQLKKLAVSIVDYVAALKTGKFKNLSVNNIDPVTGKMDRYTEECPDGFKVEGNDDVATVLIKAGVVLEVKTKTGKYSQSEEVLDKFKKHEHAGEFIKNVLDYREIGKKKAFLDDYVKKADSNGMLHPKFGVHAAKTGRYSCIAKGMKVLMPGEERNIEDVKQGDYVYCYDEFGKVKISKVKNVYFNGVRDCVRLKWQSSGTGKVGELILTADHVIKTKYRGWQPVNKLKRYDKLFHLRKGYALHKNNKMKDRVRLYGTNNYMEIEEQCIKREYFRANSEMHTHHKDENPFNNKLSNFKIKTNSEHARDHFKKYHENTVDYSHLKGISSPKPKLEKSAVWINLSKYKLLKMIAKAKGKPTKVKMDFDTFKRKCKLKGISLVEACKRYSRITGIYLNKSNILNAFSLDSRLEYASRYLGIGTRKLKQLCKVYDIQYNHMFQTIKNVGKLPVYDLEVEDHHNFIVNEICVHNCQNPNLQQVPRDSDVKNVVIAPPGYLLVQGDLSQAELRILAHYANEQSMKQVFNGFTATCAGTNGGYVFMQNKTEGDINFFFSIKNLRTGKYFCIEGVPDRPDLLKIKGEIVMKAVSPDDLKLASDAAGGNEYVHTISETDIAREFQPGDPLDTGCGDIHMFVGSQIYDVIIYHLTKEQRYLAKSTSFGIPYGTTSKGLAIRLNISDDEARNLMNLFFGKFPNVRKYIKDTVVEAYTTARNNGGVGIVKTELGRKRHIIDILDINRQRRKHAERQAVNFKIQATCHDLIVNHMISVDEEIRKRNSSARLCCQVHDSLMYYVREDEVHDFVKWLKPVMERKYLNSDIKFTADIEVYKKCWGGKKLKS